MMSFRNTISLIDAHLAVIDSRAAMYRGQSPDGPVVIVSHEDGREGVFPTSLWDATERRAVDTHDVLAALEAASVDDILGIARVITALSAVPLD